MINRNRDHAYGKHLMEYFYRGSKIEVEPCVLINEKRKKSVHHRPEIPIWNKSSLTIDEAAEYCGIGRNKLRELAGRDDCTFSVWVGSKCLIRRQKLDEYLDKAYSI